MAARRYDDKAVDQAIERSREGGAWRPPDGVDAAAVAATLGKRSSDKAVDRAVERGREGAWRPPARARGTHDGKLGLELHPFMTPHQLRRARLQKKWQQIDGIRKSTPVLYGKFAGRPNPLLMIKGDKDAELAAAPAAAPDDGDDAEAAAAPGDEWQQLQDDQGYWYYWNSRTGASQYEDPYPAFP